MMPNALKLSESVAETALEVFDHTPEKLLVPEATWCISMSSGTIAAGVVKGLLLRKADVNLVLHMGYSRSKDESKRYITEMAGGWMPRTIFVDQGFAYRDAVEIKLPFPCNAHYDAKLAQWLADSPPLSKPVVMWNVGG